MLITAETLLTEKGPAGVFHTPRWSLCLHPSQKSPHLGSRKELVGVSVQAVKVRCKLGLCSLEAEASLALYPSGGGYLQRVRRQEYEVDIFMAFPRYFFF